MAKQDDLAWIAKRLRAIASKLQNYVSPPWEANQVSLPDDDKEGVYLLIQRSIKDGVFSGVRFLEFRNFFRPEPDSDDPLAWVDDHARKAVDRALKWLGDSGNCLSDEFAPFLVVSDDVTGVSLLIALANLIEAGGADSQAQQDGAGGHDDKTSGQGDKPDGGAGSTLAGSPPAINNATGSFEDQRDFVRVCGFGEDVALEKTEGVERLIAVVTAPTRRMGVMELVRIGAAQQLLDRDPVDLDADGLTERESVNDEQFESALGDDALQAVRDEVRDLIARRKAADKCGDVAESKALKQQIAAILNPLKTELGKAAAVVRKSLERTYERLRKDGKGKKLAAHFAKYVERPRQSLDYVYQPDESERKTVWNLK